MNQLLTNSQLSELTGIFQSVYNLFSTGINNQISVVKQPINIINNYNENVMPGFQPTSMNLTDITYQPVTGVFPAIIIYPHSLKNQQFGQLKFDLDENQVMIKVQKDCRDYISQNKTEKILVENLTYGSVEQFSPSVQNYFGIKYYYFKLTVTK